MAEFDFSDPEFRDTFAREYGMALFYILTLPKDYPWLTAQLYIHKNFPLVTAFFVKGEADPTLVKHSPFLPSVEECEAGKFILEENDGGKVYEVEGANFSLDLVKVHLFDLMPASQKALFGYVGNESPDFYYPPEAGIERVYVNTFKVVASRDKVFSWGEEVKQPFTGADARKIFNGEQSHRFGIPAGCDVVDGKIVGVTETTTLNWPAFQEKIRGGVGFKLPTVVPKKE